MIGGQPFWRDVDVSRVPVLPSFHRAETGVVDWVSPSGMIAMVCALHGIEQADFFAHRRAMEPLHARAMVVWMLRTIPAEPTNYVQIGRAIDRDRTTAMDLHRMAIRLRLQNERFRRTCEAIRFQFGLPREN